MWPFKQIKAWFAFPEYRDSVAALVAYLPVGDLNAIAEWERVHIKYTPDVDDKGNYDPTKEYNGADLTIKMKEGDCESKAAVFVEVGNSPEWAADGWEFHHMRMVFTNREGELKGHDVAYFRNTRKGVQGWFENGPHIGTYTDLRQFYLREQGWKIDDLWAVNDMGERTWKR